MSVEIWVAIIAGILAFQTGLQLFWLKIVFHHEMRLTKIETICGVNHNRRKEDGK